jgi:hypothetical protein
MMKKLVSVSILIVPIFLFGEGLGLGVIAGSPTGLSLKYVLAKQAALAAHAGWSFTGDQGVHLTGDYQYLFPMVIETAEGTSISDVTPYIAAGGRFRVKKDEDTDESEFHLGLRIGGGAEYLISRFGIFLEIIPVVNLVPSTNFDLEGGVGFLFYF